MNLKNVKLENISLINVSLINISLKNVKCLLTLFFVLMGIPTKAITPYEIVKKADSFRFPKEDLSFIVKVSDLDAGKVSKTTHFKVMSKNVKDQSYSISESIFPERQKGRKLLMRGSDLWIYLPTVKRPTRISFREKLTGEVSNGDIAKTNFAEDYTATLIGKDKVDKIDCDKLSLVGKNEKEVTYSKILYWVKSTDYTPIKAEFYATSGKLIKSASYSELKPMLGKKYVTKMVITDAVVTKKQSVLVYSNFRKEKISESFFNKDTLAQ